MPRILTGAGILVALLTAPALALAAYDDVALTTDAALSVNGIELDVTGSQADIQSITVNATNFSVTLAPNSSFQVEAPNNNRINADTATGQTNYVCNPSQSLIKYAPSETVTVTITPSATLCSATSDSGSTVGGSTSTNTTPASSGGSSSGGGSSGTTSTTPVVTTPTVTPEVTTTPEATSAATTTTVPASGLSDSQVQSILDVLASFDVDAATMASVREALLGTGTGASASSMTAFTRDLEVGVADGSDVKELQMFLNTHGYTVASSGPGSSGNETTKYGALTKAAVIKYQKAKGITPAVGYFGPKTRAAVSADQ
ncbi:MAG: peptidoglycan-binding protein [Patescibacteria group bacterium]|nr:peptidoglycan-binding protein [Patescibacteria group bacterium]